jgi:hypothetical protein
MLMPLQLLHDYGTLPLITASPDGRWLVLAESPSQQVVFAPATGARLSLPALPQYEYRSHHSFTDDGLYLMGLEYASSIGGHQDLVAWRLGDEAHELLRVKGVVEPNRSTYPLLAPDGKTFATPEQDREGVFSVALYNFPQAEPIGRVDLPGVNGIKMLRWLPDGTLTLTTTVGSILQFDVAENRLKHSFKFSDVIHKSVVAPNGSAVAVFSANSGADFREPGYATMKQWVEVCDFPAGSRRFRFPVDKSLFVSSLSFSPDSSLLAVFMDKMILVYDAVTRKKRGEIELKVSNGRYKFTQFLNDGTLLVSDGVVRVYTVTP